MKIAPSSACALTSTQDSHIKKLCDQFRSYGQDMANLIDTIELRLEKKKSRQLYVDINECKRQRDDLYNQLRALSETLNIEFSNEIYEERKRIEWTLGELQNIIDKGYKEQTLLGEYSNGVISLFLDNISDAEQVLPLEFKKGNHSLEYLTGYVFVHEMYHAYYDMGHTLIPEIEEPMAEFAALSFLETNDPETFAIAEYKVIQNRYSPLWISAYSFGKYIYDQHPTFLIDEYRSNKQTIDERTNNVLQYKKGFSTGYPWKNESYYYDLLLQIIQLRKNSSNTTKKHIVNGRTVVEYFSKRLSFKANEIEPLSMNDSFIIHTPEGSFEFTKSDFYNTFPNVIASRSYQQGLYSYSVTPKKANIFLIAGQQYKKRNQSPKYMLTKNPIENEIRAIIKVTGILWHNSPNNPLSPKNQSINRGILSQWSELIDKWIKDPSIPLIVRKDAQEGQVITHPSGREIIVTDNTFAVWVFEQVLKGYIPSLKDMSNKLGNKKAPRGNMTGWKLRHIKPVGLNTKENISNLEISVIEDHFRKYADPNNMFVLPKEIGGLGEIDEFINEQ